MRYFDENNCREAVATTDLLDYSEEAIPERDPSYRLPAGTDYEPGTVEVVSPEVRLEMALLLQELGMSRARAVFVANL